MKPQIDPKVDYAFKHVFGREESKPVLASLIDAVLQPAADRQISSLDLMNPFNDKESPDDKLSILDIKARDESGRQFNVEMQMLAAGDFPPAGALLLVKITSESNAAGDGVRGAPAHDCDLLPGYDTFPRTSRPPLGV